MVISEVLLWCVAGQIENQLDYPAPCENFALKSFPVVLCDSRVGYCSHGFGA